MGKVNFYNCASFAYDFNVSHTGYVSTTGLKTTNIETYTWKLQDDALEINFRIFSAIPNGTVISGHVIDNGTGLEIVGTPRIISSDICVFYDCVFDAPIPAGTILRFTIVSPTLVTDNMWLNIGLTN